jgi:hypothetical protein
MNVNIFCVKIQQHNIIDINFLWCFTMQIINVYNQQYESAAAFWPQVHSRIIASLIISQLLLLGLLSTKKAARSTPLLVLLPILTFAFHKYCKHRFEPAFRKYPVEVCGVNVHKCNRPILQITIPVSNISIEKGLVIKKI